MLTDINECKQKTTNFGGGAPIKKNRPSPALCEASRRSYVPGGTGSSFQGIQQLAHYPDDQSSGVFSRGLARNGIGWPRNGRGHGPSTTGDLAVAQRPPVTRSGGLPGLGPSADFHDIGTRRLQPRSGLPFPPWARVVPPRSAPPIRGKFQRLPEGLFRPWAIEEGIGVRARLFVSTASARHRRG